MKNSKPELGMCRSCHGVVYTAWSQGLTVAVDANPLDEGTYLIAIMQMRPTYDLVKMRDGSIGMMLPRSQFSQWGTHEVAQEHACRDAGVDIFKIRAAPKVKAPASFSSAKKAFVRKAMRRASPVSSATHRLSRPARCDVCRRRVYISDEGVISIEWATYIWAVHEECP